MSSGSGLDPFGLHGEEWLGLLREAEAPPELGTLGPFRLVREIGRGGQAVVFEAIQLPEGTRVALKLLVTGSYATPTTLQRFEREVEVVSLLSHPNVVRAEGMQIHDGKPVLVMEWIDGTRITEWARGREREHVLDAIRKVADAVAHAHRLGVMHRDLKPENILVSADDEPHVLDFGLARWSELDDSGRTRITRTSQFVGTPAYASPEQIGDDPRHVDARTDVYSLGVIAYELLTGRLPYDVGGGLRQVIETIATRDPRPPRELLPDLDRDLEAILLQMLAKDRDRRYHSMDLFLADLDRFARGDTVDARSTGGTYRLRRLVRRNRLPLAIVAGFVLTSLGFGITMAVLYDRAESEADRVAQVEAFLGSMLAPEGSTAAHGFTVVDILRHASARLDDEPIADRDVRGRLHLRLARNYASIWHWPEAADHARAALEIYRELGDERGVARALTDLGLAETFADDPAAVAHHEEALAIVERLEGSRSIAAATSLGVLGFAYFRAADPPDPERAESCYERALAILEAEDEPPRALAGTLYSHAVLAMERGDMQTATDRFERALEVFEIVPTSMNVTVARCMEDYAKALARLGRVDDARHWVERSRQGRPPDAGMCVTSEILGTILAGEGEVASAGPFFLESLTLTCDYLAMVHPERSARYARLGDAFARGELDAAALASIGRTCEAQGGELGESWRQTMRGLERVYLESERAPARAAICRRALALAADPGAGGEDTGERRDDTATEPGDS